VALRAWSRLLFDTLLDLFAGQSEKRIIAYCARSNGWTSTTGTAADRSEQTYAVIIISSGGYIAFDVERGDDAAARDCFRALVAALDKDDAASVHVRALQRSFADARSRRANVGSCLRLPDELRAGVPRPKQTRLRLVTPLPLHS
jgi:hypothetical protein